VAANRRALLDAAAVVFRRDGYLGATVESIAEAAGFTRGAVYSHFANKGDLFLTLLEERIADRAVDNQAAVAEAVDPADAVAVVRQVVAASLDPAWRLALLEFRVVAARDPDLNARYATVHDLAIRSVSDALTALYRSTGIEPPLPVDVLASASLAMEDGGFLESVVRADALPADTIVQIAAQLLGIPRSEAAEPEAP
jgi:AcrR family transcriptional regulator